MPPLTQPSIDFHLRISASTGSEFRIQAASTGSVPSASAAFSASLIKKQIRPLAETLTSGGRFTEPDLQKLGALNFEALFSGAVRDLYRSLQAGLDLNRRLRILLEIEPPALRMLPWEVLYDPWLNAYVSEQESISILRYSTAAPLIPTQATPAPGGVRILVVSSQPSDAPTVYADEEIARLKSVVESEIKQDWLSFDFRGGTVEEIRAGLRGEPDVLHFIGHAGLEDNSPGVYLEENGLARFANEAFLESQVLVPERQFLKRLRLLVLNACQTSAVSDDSGASLAEQLLPWAGSVIAMQYPIEEKASQLFSAALYQSLAQSKPVDSALSAARLAIRKGDPADQRGWVTPVLYTNGASFSIQKQLNPFKGAQPYTQGDRYAFLGREMEAAALMELVSECPVVLLAGAGGSGKTSLLQAGFKPLIERTRPCLLLTTSDSIEAQVAEQLNTHLLAQKAPQLTGASLQESAARFPDDLIILLDRAEQAGFLGEAARAALLGLVEWTKQSQSQGKSGRLVLAARVDHQGGASVDFWARIVPNLTTATLTLNSLDRDSMANMILRTGESAGVFFKKETIARILADLDYENQPNMMQVQVVCRALYRYAREQRMDQIQKEVLSSDPPGGVGGIMKRDFDIGYRLEQAEDALRQKERLILVQLLSSEPGRSRRVPEELILARLAGDPAARQALSRLEEDGLIALTVEHGQRVCELTHDALCSQIEAFSEADSALRKLEEVIDSAGSGLLPARAGTGCLSDLSQARDRGVLLVSDSQKAMLLRSALEAGYEVESWSNFAGKAALSTLTNPDLGDTARIRAAVELARLAKGAADPAAFTSALFRLAVFDREPAVRSAASGASAGILTPSQLAEYLSQGGDPDEKAVRSLAEIYAQDGSALSLVKPEVRKRAVKALLGLRSTAIYSSALRAALVGALGFAVIGMYNWYRWVLQPGADALYWVTWIPLALLAFFLALPGSSLPVLGRELASIYAGNHRPWSSRLGLITGAVLGTALTLFLITALSQLGSGEGLSLLPTAAGAFLGLVLGAGASFAGWLAQKLPSARSWLSLVTCAVLGGAAGYLLQLWEWWLDSSIILRPKFSIEWLLTGAVIGLAFALSIRSRLSEKE